MIWRLPENVGNTLMRAAELERDRVTLVGAARGQLYHTRAVWMRWVSVTRRPEEGLTVCRMYDAREYAVY